MTSKNNKIKFIDLFCGTGGFSIGLEQNPKFECIWANDFIKQSQEIYTLNNNTPFKLADINDVDPKNIPHHDLLCAGFPCQPFSIAGKQGGFKDSRSNVFWKIMEIADHHKTPILILENVKNLKSHDSGKTYKIIIKTLTDNGYYVTDNILDTSKITEIPQYRERIYMVCFREKNRYDKFNLDFPEIKSLTVSDLLEDNIPDKYYYTDRLKIYDNIKNEITNPESVYQYRRHYVRENKSKICPTLTCNMGSGGHNVPIIIRDNQIRKLTPRECFNLQGFSKNYKLPNNMSDSSLYKLAGNAISIPVVKLISDKLAKIL